MVADVVRKKPAPGIWPERIVFDFQNLKFIQPTGVVFLHNIIRWLQAKKCSVAFRGHNADSAPLKYLRDALFFELHLEGRVSSSAPSNLL
jgi:hypothetical protein